jgi:enamine deaminase RidA (YjgF/YER057c/UK114 family)
MSIATRINPESLHRSPFFSQAVRVPAGAATVYVGEQTRQAFRNLIACLEAAGAELTDVVKWTILVVEGVPLEEGVAVFGEFWPRDAEPPAITVAIVSDLGPPGALVEIEAIAAVAAS